MAYLPLLILALILRLVLVALKPIVHIRFGRLHSFELGSYGIPMEAYLCQRDTNILPKRTLDIFYHYVHKHFALALEKPASPQKLICNRQLDKMITSWVRVWEPARALDNLNNMLPGATGTFTVTSQQPYDQFGLFRRVPPHLTFDEAEENRGQDGLRQLGIPAGGKFFCFHTRDGLWLRRAHPRVTSLYGQWGGGELRNASIHNILPAAEQLSQLGYHGVRMGKFVEEPINSSNPMIVDYATDSHSDFMDVYLSAKCEFFLGVNSGMIHLPTVFRRPMALANIYPMGCIEEGVTYEQHIFMPKIFHSREKGRLLSFRETLDYKLGRFYLSSAEDRELYDRLGLELLENTAEEITELTTEMHQRLQSEYKTTAEDEERQARFWEIVRAYPDVITFEDGVEPNFRIGAGFLRRHPELLD